MRPSRRPTHRRGARFWRHILFGEPWGYLVGGLTSAASAALSLLAAPHASLAHVMIIYLLGAVVISTRFGAAVSTFTVLTSTLCFDYFNIPPQFAFATPSVHDSVTLGGMLLTAILVSFLIQRLRYQRSLARSSEARTLALCELSLDLSQATHQEHLPATAEAHLVKLFGLPSQVFLRDSMGDLARLSLPGSERELLQRALDTRTPWSERSSRGEVVFQPINSGDRTLGVIRSELSEGDFSPTGQDVLLAACADRLAVALERWTLAAAARKAHVEVEAERLRSELLSAMSHDLKTPLASILAAGSTLLNRSDSAEPGRHLLLHTIVEETERLNGLVTNLLTVTRLEAGTVRLNKVPEALDDLVHGALSRFTSRLGQREIQVTVPDELPLVCIDPVLIDQVLANLIENALRYTPDASPLEVSLRADDEETVLELCDRGPGIPDHERGKVFDKFYRGSSAKLKDGGSGLGLTICRAVARAHGGRIAVHPRAGGGTRVEFALPRSAPGDVQPLPLPQLELAQP